MRWANAQAFGGSNDSSSISGGGSGYVKNITFSNFHAEKVDNPVVIDQVCQDRTFYFYFGVN